MDTRTLKIFMACAFGALVGATVALQLSPIFWWVGMLAGGLVGYLTYDLREVGRAIVTAGREVWGKFFFALPSLEDVKAIFYTTAATLHLLILIALFSELIFYLVAPFDFIEAFKLFVTVVGLFSTACLPMVIGLYFIEGTTASQKIIVAKDVIHRINLIYGGIYLVPYLLIKETILFLAKTPRFVYRVFILVHSEFRLLCGFDAALGAAIGYFAGSATLGALIGGVAGVINYELVSKRWLKLVPKP
jgi:hypothetical protein